VKCGGTVYVSGQIPLDPATGQLVVGDMEAQIRRAFDNVKAIVLASGAELSHVAKVNIFLIDLGHFQLVNKVMSEYFAQPYPARAALQVSALPKGAQVEIDCVVEM
jgi:reactive intermediate/imine deaminase